MTIADQSFGSELVTAKGKIYKYDSIECLAAADRQMEKAAGAVHSRWVINFSQPGSFLEVPKATIVATEHQKSPMGVGLVAVGSSSEADALIQSVGGAVLDWTGVKALVAETWKLEGKK
jgi:copper chaperone NosL